MQKYCAHRLADHPIEKWQPLEEHLENTAKLCRQFAEQFKAGALGELAGRFHDLGKGSLQFQAYLRHANNIEDEFSAYFDSRRKRDHATFGARHLNNLSKHTGKLIAYCIAGQVITAGCRTGLMAVRTAAFSIGLRKKNLKKLSFLFIQILPCRRFLRCKLTETWPDFNYSFS